MTGDGQSRGLAPRPDIPPEILAVVAAAVDQAWPRPQLAVPVEEPEYLAWRFSGRWWHRPITARRARPYTQH